MTVQRMLLPIAILASASALCMAQSSMGSQGQSGSMGQQGMGHQNGANMPSSMSTTDTDQGNMKSPDEAFMMKAAQGGKAEVQLGNLAKQNGSSTAVKEFGNRMVTDHSNANDQLSQLAQQKGITLPSNVNMKDKRTEKMLESKQGPAFDKAYIHDMVKDHETDVAEFRREADSGKDPEVRAWAQKTLPILEQHLAAAKQIAGQVGAPTAMSSNEKQ